MSAKFTNGPWIRTHHANGVQRVVAGHSLNGEYDICHTRGPDEVENSHLIAAAPEMYEMLDKLSPMLTDVNAHTLVNEIESILAKARGEA